MKSLNPIRIATAFVIAVSLLFTLLQYYSIPCQFYFWEIFIDLKPAVLILFVLSARIGGQRIVQWTSSGIVKWNWMGNILWFFFPVAVLLVTVAFGYIFNAVETGDLDNTATMILQTLFDIPAIFLFSLTTIIIEELFFRQFLFQMQRQIHTIFWSTFFNSMLWTIYYIPELLNLDLNSFYTFAIIAFFVFSTGILLNLIWWKTETIWYGYSMRIGISAIFPMIISSNFAESEPFFKTTSVIFEAEGLAISLIFIISAVFLYKTKNRHSMEIREISGQ